MSPTSAAGGGADGAPPDLLDDSRLRALGLAPGQESVNGPHATPSADHPPAPLGGPGPGGDPVDLLPDTPMWLSHHWPPDYDRCAVVAGLHVCRRCLVLYPLARVVDAGRGLGWWSDAWALFMKNAGMWIVLAIATMLILGVISLVPLLGSLAASVLFPPFMASWMLAARKLQSGGSLEIGDLFLGFKDKLNPLLVLGAAGRSWQYRPFGVARLGRLVWTHL